ncbi:hypothetical protein BCR41DRAFT_306823 [Lobosporangium transversale]|uniref:Uncharacterized protein n=1 Tax=Lobosporangium transversale TaxID=64571 RepID=A0A1Y2GLD0_9FUNG|nr:hypothetical protein BCR41DRAFT_306823 [Lobosporangium transversale]ORZ14421.1 hypothetical protein BCR41DRAFT_306823 [Lobosporangium transversale]|eukprot:XP_021880899.1 hypothetical protein BCR41DRAFT_306823 [Lobosporangium transversale]
MTVVAAAVATVGSTAFSQGVAAASKVLDSKANELVVNIEKNPALSHLIQLADKLVDVGKVVPFIAPAFVILKIIIDVEQKARDVDAKCTDLLERINFMVSNLTVLEKIPINDSIKVVIDKTNNTLKQAASLIQTYRKQGTIARRLNMSNSQNFIQMAVDITTCTQDLMLSLQIQQTGDLSVLTRAVPSDTKDDEARLFVQQHGGHSVVINSPELVEEFAKKMHLTMSDQVMEQMQSNMEDLMDENQTKIEALLKENSSNVVAETIKVLATQIRGNDAEQRLTCVQCDKEYQESANGPAACSFHKSMEQGGSYSCCGKKSPCTYSSHRSAHHCEYPYTAFYDFAFAISGYTDTKEEWAEIEEEDMLTGTVQKACVSKLLRWRSHHERIKKPMMIIHVGRVSYDNPYYFQAFGVDDIKATNASIRKTGTSLIFRTTLDNDAYAMAEWVIDPSGMINGIKISCKVATSESATTKLVPLDIETVSPSGEIQTLSKVTFKVYRPAEPYKLPEIRYVGHTLPMTPLREVRQFKVRTKLPIVMIPEGKMKANGDGGFVRRDADKFKSMIRIFNKTPPSSQTYVTLASCKAEYRIIGEKEYKEVNGLDLGGIKFPVSIGPMQSADISFEAIVLRTQEQAALMLSCWDWALVALHSPIRIRLTFTDIEGEECSFIQEYIHQPSLHMAVKNEEKDLLFLYIDNMLEGTRSAIRVSKPNDSDTVVDVNGTKYTIAELNRIVYKAEKDGITEVLLDCGRSSEEYKWDAWALVDLSCRRVYAFKILLSEGYSRSKKVAAALGYALCPLYGEEDGVAIEERPIRYADEKSTFPDLESQEVPAIMVDDDVDDDVDGKKEPAIAIATAASSSVAAAISEVVKVTSSLDTATFLSSMASLEKRIESLDTNVARMATALEKLVDILGS